MINNNHRLNYSLVPDVDFNKKSEATIQDKVQEKASKLSADDKNQLVSLTNDLKDRQEKHDDPEILPKVTKSDIPETRSFAKAKIVTSNLSLIHI